jgi:hypothetical protein
MSDKAETAAPPAVSKNPMLMLQELDKIKSLPEKVQEKFAMMAYNRIQQTFDWEMAVQISSSSLVPKDYKGNPANTFLAIQTGRSLGLDEFQSVQHLCTINGRTSIFGDMMLALAKKDPNYDDIIETEGPLIQADAKHGMLPEWTKCTVKCKGQADRVQVYTLDMAKKNKNYSNEYTPWMTGSAARMMKFRARSFALRDAFPDRLAGVYDEYEIQEVRDITDDVNEATSASGLDAMEQQTQEPETVVTDPPKTEETLTDLQEEKPGLFSAKLTKMIEKSEYYAIIQVLLKDKKNDISADDIRTKDESRAKEVVEAILEKKADLEKAAQQSPPAPPADDEETENGPEAVVKQDIARLIELGEVKQATLFQNNFDKIPAGEGYINDLTRLSIQLRKAVNLAEKK